MVGAPCAEPSQVHGGADVKWQTNNERLPQSVLLSGSIFS